MSQIGVRELNQRTSQVLDRVRAGETLEVTDRGTPVAEIRPVRGGRAVIARLVSERRLAPATVDPAIVDSMPMEPQDGVNVADLLSVARDEERW